MARTVRTFAEVAQALGVSESRVGWWKKQGAPIKVGGPNDLDRISEWRRDYEASHGKSDHSGLDDADAKELRRQILREDAEGKRLANQSRKLKLAREAERLVNRDEFLGLYLAEVKRWRDQIRGRLVELLLARLPDEWQTRLRPEVRSDVDRFLNEMPEGGKEP